MTLNGYRRLLGIGFYAAVATSLF